MLYIMYLVITLTAGSVLLALVSNAFAYELSHVIEAVFDMIEYRLALGAERHATGAHAGGFAKVSGSAQARLSLRPLS